MVRDPNLYEKRTSPTKARPSLTLTMSLAHDIEGGGGLLIRYPAQVVVHSPLKVSVDATAYGITDILTEPEIDDSARWILFAGTGKG